MTQRRRKQRTGKFLWTPYDWRRPTAARVSSRWWNRDDPRVFTPKSYGWGWSLNLARLLGLKPKPKPRRWPRG